MGLIKPAWLTRSDVRESANRGELCHRQADAEYAELDIRILRVTDYFVFTATLKPIFSTVSTIFAGVVLPAS